MALTALRQKHLLGIADLSPDEIVLVLDTADAMKEVGQRTIKKVPTLRGRTVINLFFEPSTRTRTSFEIAEKRLSADTLNISVTTSSVLKGETLASLPWIRSRLEHVRILEFRDTAGSSCGALLPTGHPFDVIGGIRCTLIDNGMPCVVFKAADVGATGYETRAELDAADELKARIEQIRLTAGPLMNLGDVAKKTVPKMMLVARPRSGGAVTVRSFIPHRAHASVGVLGAVSVATACLVDGSPAAEVADIPGGSRKILSVEHPSGEMSCVLEVGEGGQVVTAALLRTARKLMDGIVFA